MTVDGTHPTGLSSDEVYVCIAGRESSGGQYEPIEETVRSTARRGEDGHLAIVRISDGEIDALRGQVERIVRRLESRQYGPAEHPAASSAAPADSGHFGVDSITVHVGLSATGHFFFVAGAGVEAAIDITWSRK